LSIGEFGLFREPCLVAFGALEAGGYLIATTSHGISCSVALDWTVHQRFRAAAIYESAVRSIFWTGWIVHFVCFQAALAPGNATTTLSLARLRGAGD